MTWCFLQATWRNFDRTSREKQDSELSHPDIISVYVQEVLPPRILKVSFCSGSSTQPAFIGLRSEIRVSDLINDVSNNRSLELTHIIHSEVFPYGQFYRGADSNCRRRHHNKKIQEVDSAWIRQFFFLLESVSGRNRQTVCHEDHIQEEHGVARTRKSTA